MKLTINHDNEFDNIMTALLEHHYVICCKHTTFVGYKSFRKAELMQITVFEYYKYHYNEELACEYEVTKTGIY